jgi:hypothetical protein
MGLRQIPVLTIMLYALALTACSVTAARPEPVSSQQGTAHTPSVPAIQPEPPTLAAPTSNLPLNSTWQIQYSGELDLSLDVDVYNLDLFETSPDDIAGLHARGIYVMCYFSAGTWEDWRPDADRFPAIVLGTDYAGWPGERWLDVRAINVLSPIMESRIRLATEKGCDGVDSDNVDGFENKTGFPITYADQLDFNLWLSQTAHIYDLDIGLKNDLTQINDMLLLFDWVLNEECFSYHECDLLSPFREAGKPVFVIEYEATLTDFCPQAQELGFNAIYKNRELDAYRESCQ